MVVLPQHDEHVMHRQLNSLYASELMDGEVGDFHAS
jgi:hypothetical protein